MEKKIKIALLVVFSLLLCFLSYKLCYFIAEKYFFDKFFYQKSSEYGYRLYDNKLTFKDFGQRAEDLKEVYQSAANSKPKANFGNQFQVIIIGDSYVWGQGLKNDQRFAKLLSDQLNKIRPTKVISLAEPGWNILDYLAIYPLMMNHYSPNLIIYALVSNDNLINNNFINKPETHITSYTSGLNSPIVQECTEANPGVPPVTNIDVTHMSDLSAAKSSAIISKNDIAATLNPINNCVFDNSLQLLPTQNAIYFLTADYNGQDPSLKDFSHYLTQNNKYVLSSSQGKNMPRYSKYFTDPANNFVISKIEGHPNALANQMYTSILFHEITTNPKWGFTK